MAADGGVDIIIDGRECHYPGARRRPRAQLGQANVTRQAVAVAGALAGAAFVLWFAVVTLDHPSVLGAALAGASGLLVALYLLEVWATWPDVPAQRNVNPPSGSFAALVVAYAEKEWDVRASLLACLELFDPTDVLLVDDSARVELAHLARRFGIRYSVRERPSGGRSGAVAHGIAMLHSDFIVVISGDQIVHRDLIRRAAPLFEERRSRLP